MFSNQETIKLSVTQIAHAILFSPFLLVSYI